MSKVFWVLAGIVLVLGLVSVNPSVAAEMKVDEEGFVRDWLFLGPWDLPGEDTAPDEIVKKQIADEGAIKPKEGDKQKIADKELTWKAIKADTWHFDLNKITKKANEDVGGYLVTYVVADADMAGLTLAIGSNDQAKVYVNGKQVMLFSDTRTIEKDSDTAADITLKKGVNVIVFKVLNQKNDWQGALRFKDKAGKPVTTLKVQLAP